MSNLLTGIRGDAVEVAGTRGFLPGISETSRKCLRPCVKSSLFQHVQRTSLLEKFLFFFTPPAQLAHQVLFSRCMRRSSADVFPLNTYPLPNEPEVNFALVIGLLLISRCGWILCDK